MRDEFVKLLFTEELLQVVQESETFLVWNAGEGIVGIFAFEVNDKLREFVILAVLVDRVT